MRNEIIEWFGIYVLVLNCQLSYSFKIGALSAARKSHHRPNLLEVKLEPTASGDNEKPQPSILTDVLGINTILAGLSGEIDDPVVRDLPGILGPLEPIIDPLLNPTGRLIDPVLGPSIAGLNPVFVGIDTVLGPVVGPIFEQYSDSILAKSNMLRNGVIVPVATLLRPLKPVISGLAIPIELLAGPEELVTVEVPTTILIDGLLGRYQKSKQLQLL